MSVIMSSENVRFKSKRLWEESSDSESSSDSDNNENNELLARVQNRAPRNFRIRLNNFQQWNDEEFRIRFRLSKDTVAMLEQRIGHFIAPRTERNHALTAMQQILLVLRFCATGCMLQTISDFVGIHKSTAGRVIRRVITAITTLAPDYIQMPSTQEEIELTKKKFYNIARFPRVIGAIDCTHIKINSQGGDNAEYFRNRKTYFSLNVQVVGDADLRIRDIVARWPGSTHDQTVFNNSQLQARFVTDQFGNAVLLGDSGYALKKYLITPILNPTTEAEQLFNESQIRSRNPIERLFGVLKRRFPVLSLGIRLSLETAKSIIVACAVLHNIALDMKEQDPIQDPNLIFDIEGQPENNIAANNFHNFREEFIIYFLNLMQQNR